MGSRGVVIVFFLFLVLATSSDIDRGTLVPRQNEPLTSCLLEFGRPAATSCKDAIWTLHIQEAQEMWVPQMLWTGTLNRCGKQWKSGNKTPYPENRLEGSPEHSTSRELLCNHELWAALGGLW